MMSDHPSGAAVQATTNRRRDRILVVTIFAVVWGLITHGTFAGSGDEPHYAIIAHSVAFDGDLDLENNYRDAALIGGGTLLPEAHALHSRGRLRPVHDIGMPLALAAVVRIAYSAALTLGETIPKELLDAVRLNEALLFRHQLSLVMALFTGLLARELLLLIRALGGSGWSAVLWALLFALTPPIISHSFLFFTEIPTALIMLFVFRRLALHPRQSAAFVTFLGTVAGFLLLVHARNIGIVAGLLILTLLMARQGTVPWTSFLAFLSGVTAGVLVRTLITFVLWGALVTTPHATFGGIMPAGEFLGEMFARGTGLLFDREFGLLAYGPIYLLAVPGFVVVWRLEPSLSWGLFVLLASYLVPVLLPLTNVHGWTGGWSPAARFLVPIAPLLWLGVYAYGVHAAGLGKTLVGLLMAYQVAINGFVWQFPKVLWNDGDGVSAFSWTRWLPTLSSSSDATLPFATALITATVLAYWCSKYAIQPRHAESGSGGH
jgi:hypothetical protein